MTAGASSSMPLAWPFAASLYGFGHASYLIPKPKNLFYVYFVFKQGYMLTTSSWTKVGYICKTCEKPKFQYKTVELDQYNRKRIVQTKIQYQPMSFTFHETEDSVMSKFAYDYNAHNYGDFSHVDWKDESSSSHDNYWDKSIISGDNSANWGYRLKNPPAKTGDSTDLLDSLENAASNLWSSAENYGISKAENYVSNAVSKSAGGGLLGGLAGGTASKIVGNLASSLLGLDSDTTNSLPTTENTFEEIRVYEFFGNKFTQYTIMNPIVEAISCDAYSHDSADGLEITLTVNPEGIVYNFVDCEVSQSWIASTVLPNGTWSTDNFPIWKYVKNSLISSAMAIGGNILSSISNDIVGVLSTGNTDNLFGNTISSVSSLPQIASSTSTRVTGISSVSSSGTTNISTGYSSAMTGSSRTSSSISSLF